ncbi:MAG: GatB domain [Caudoviricetes sp.]|nr:MAG: GatB domain [Caudoviricetes sp.]
MDINTSKAVTAIISKDITTYPSNMGVITCNIFNNQFQSILNQNKFSFEDLLEYRVDFCELFSDLCYLRSLEFIKTQHVKDLLEYGWKNPYFDLCKYLIDKKILDVVDEELLKEKIVEHLNNNIKIVEQVKNGKPQVAGSIIGLLKKDFGNKFNPSDAMSIIMSTIEGM